MDQPANDTLMQVVGMSAAILPVVLLALGLWIASLRRQRAERMAETTSAPAAGAAFEGPTP